MATVIPKRVEKFIAEIDADLEKLQGEIDAHQAQIQPKVDEYNALVEFKSRVTGSGAKNGRRGGTRSAGGGSGVARGKRLEQLIEAVTAEPGVTVAQAAAKIGVEPNYLYRVRDKAVSAERIREDEGKLYPVPA